ncbi:MAG TPA: OmpA family protein [Chryseosolibacter sp.]
MGSISKKTFLSGCLALLFFFASGQALKEQLAKGDRFFAKKDYANALKYYREALTLDPDDAGLNYKTGICYLNGENASQAAFYLEKALRLDPQVDPFIHFHLAMAYQADYKFAMASEHFLAFKKRNKKLSGLANEKIRECHIGDSLMQIPVNAEVHALGPEINSPFAEHSPLITPDGRTLIFTSTRSADDYAIKSGTNYEDVYVSHRDGDGWSAAQKIGPNLNVRFNEAAVSLSPDGKTLFLYYEEGHGDIYTSRFENNEWTKPVALNQFINHPLYRETAASLSADGTRLYFSSNRPGGKGGLDIYVSQLGANGDWGRPSNLGTTVNTRKDEDSPFAHADGVTLYFSSNGHPSVGSNDIFKTELKNGRWTRPENVGYPVNTSGYDGFFTLSPDKKTGYYSAHPGAPASNTDIFAVTFLPAKTTDKVLASVKATPEEARDDNGRMFALLKGVVKDLKTSAPLEATVVLVDNSTKQIVSQVTADASGYFELAIPQSGNYGVTTRMEGYLFHSLNVNLPATETFREIEASIGLAKPVIGSKVVLKNIFFDVNESALKAESLTELENIRAVLVRNPRMRIQVNGHTDNVGDSRYNLALSLKRAQSVVEYLVEHGIPAGRLEARGYGSERPLVSNDDEEEGRQINRRTEIEIIK